jgi:hypothetical protein
VHQFSSILASWVATAPVQAWHKLGGSGGMQVSILSGTKVYAAFNKFGNCMKARQEEERLTREIKGIQLT